MVHNKNIVKPNLGQHKKSSNIIKYNYLNQNLKNPSKICDMCRFHGKDNKTVGERARHMKQLFDVNKRVSNKFNTNYIGTLGYFRLKV